MTNFHLDNPGTASDGAQSAGDFVKTIEPVSADPPAWEHQPVFRQRWDELAYFHWRYEPDVVQRLLPTGVRVDTFDGSAWVGLIPFEMRDVQVGPTQPVPWFGSFIEINVRTYVVDPRGRRAVWFFSLDVPRAAIVALARSVFSLPYCWADVHHERAGDRHRYRTSRRFPHRARPTADIAFTVGGRLPDEDVGDLGQFLSARWALVTSRRDQLLYGPVHHERWPLHEIGDVEIRQEIIEAAGLPSPSGAPHAMYSPGIGVEVAWFERVETGVSG
jgi:uncharacterized protein YqjF (DUF2071 family)